MNMEDGKTDPVVFTNYQSGEDLNIGTREIKTAEFHNSKLETIPVELLDHKELEGVIFNDCRLTHIQNLEELKVCQNITKITLKECNLQALPNFLSEFHTLNSLNMPGNSFKEGTLDSMKNLINLEKLDLSNCMLPTFPWVLCNLKSLTELNIGWNDKIQNLPGALENLTNLETLNVYDCGLIEFPQVLCKLKSLRELNIGESYKIKNLPEALENLTNLETLNVCDCDLIEFPQVLCKLKSLKELDIGWNYKIQNLPDALENLTNLEILDVTHCDLREFPQILYKLVSLKKLFLRNNPDINSLPGAIERCKRLEALDISYCQINELPTIIFNMKNLSVVTAEKVPIEVLNEDFVKLWLQKPDIFTKCQFQKKVKHDALHFVKPPHEIVKRGPEACMRYYRSLRADNAVNCNVLNVTLMGKTGAGKSSLIHSIKEGSSVLADPLDRTVVVDELEVKHEDVLLKIADFGGHDIYEMTCPLFLKSRKQVAIVAVKLSEYSESNHDELVTNWLTTAVSHMKNGSICIVATQCDLCNEQEVTEKTQILKKEVQKWIKEESLFWKKLRSTHTKGGILDNKKFHYFKTSSLDMQGLENVREFLFEAARSNRAVLPKRWIEVYKKMNEEAARFITENQYQAMFKKCIPSPNRDELRISWTSNTDTIPSEPRMLDTEESHLCLQFLHDSRMVLWYGEKHQNLRKIIFHNPLFLVSVLQCLFRHDLSEVLKYDHEHFGSYFNSRTKFQDAVTRFIQTGILSPMLLKCIWKELELSQDMLFNTMVEMLTMLDLCYSDRQSPDCMLRLPWFVQDKDMSTINDLWPGKPPPETLQYTFTYCFCHRIPGVIYERFCVRLQRHLQKGGYTRMDRKDAVYIEQNAVQVFLLRHPQDIEPYMQIHLRCTFENIFELQKLCVALHQDIDDLCIEYSGLYIDSYLLCPHCLSVGSEKPTKRPAACIDEKVPLDWVPCDPFTPGSDKIPAALIFLRLLGQYQ